MANKKRRRRHRKEYQRQQKEAFQAAMKKLWMTPTIDGVRWGGDHYILYGEPGSWLDVEGRKKFGKTDECPRPELSNSSSQ